jgi:hypothetical protein
MDRQGMILAADSTHGKTTLVLGLLRRGLRFLSDEMAALGRADGLVHPFPRTLSIRPGTLELVGYPEAASQAPLWRGNLLVDVEALQPDCMGEAAAINHIIIVRDPGEEDERLNGSEREFTALVDRLDERFVAAAQRIEGVSDLRTGLVRGLPSLALRARHRVAALSQLEALAQLHGVFILDVIKGDAAQPTFDAPAQLEPIPNSQAVMQLLGRFQGGHRSALLAEEFEGSSTRMFVELASLIEQARCYQLSLGPLNEMLDLICGLVE